MKKLGMFFVMVLAAGAVCAQGAGETETYVFATDATWAPMEFVDESGEIVGFDIDLINAIAEAEDMDIEIRNVAWDGIFAGLANRAYDGVISSVTITEERKRAMDFSDPYFNAGQSLLIRTDTDDVETLEDLGGRRVGVQNGTTGDFVLDDYPDVIRMAYDDIPLAVEDLLNGNVDGVVCDTPIAEEYVMKNPNFAGRLQIVGGQITEEFFGIAVHKDNSELLEKINSGLSKVRESGTYDEIYSKWFL